MTLLQRIQGVLVALGAALMLVTATPMPAQAVEPVASATQPAQKSEGLSGRALYDEAIAVSKLLRDPSSANNTLYESETALSGELKALIYQKLREGASRGEILDYMAERYGEAVRYQPDFNATTFLLPGLPQPSAPCFSGAVCAGAKSRPQSPNRIPTTIAFQET